MQLALFPPNLPGPLKQALAVLEALPGGLKALESAPAEGDFWMRLATQLQGLEEVAGALPQDGDAEALAAWLAASLGGEPLPQGGEDLPVVAPEAASQRLPVPAPEGVSRWLPGTGEGRPKVPWLGEHLPALPVHASTPAPDGMPGYNPPGIQTTMEVPTDRAAGVHARLESALAVAPNQFAAAPVMDSASVAPPASSPTGLARMFQLDVPLHQPGWDRALGDRVQWLASQKVQVAELRLNPPNLGPLEVRVHVEGDRTHINFLAPQAAVRDAIDAALPRLREMFAESGLNLGDVTVAHQDARQAGGDRGHGPGQAGPGRADAARADSIETGRAERLRQGLGLVDYYA